MFVKLYRHSQVFPLLLSQFRVLEIRMKSQFYLLHWQKGKTVSWNSSTFPVFSASIKWLPEGIFQCIILQRLMVEVLFNISIARLNGNAYLFNCSMLIIKIFKSTPEAIQSLIPYHFYGNASDTLLNWLLFEAAFFTAKLQLTFTKAIFCIK